jgi:parallel beta-helix repeat protein
MSLVEREARVLFLKAGAVAAAAAILLGLNAQHALGAHVACGDTITEDTELDSDLNNCAGTGLAIGADNVALDLNGHTVDGTHGQKLGTDGPNGIDNSEGHDGIELTGPGAIRDFEVGIALVNASDNVIRRLEASANLEGISLDGHTATGNVIARTVLTDNLFTGIRLSDAYALNVAAGHNELRKNTAFQNGTGIVIGGYGDGNVISRNRLFENGRGILLSDSFGRSLVAKNAIFRNAGAGIDSIELQNTRIERNKVIANGSDGIEIDDHNNIIQANVANGNGDDGIDVPAENAVTRNTANRNADLGIEATPGVIDGGGNKARRNGNPLQCTNVVCR